MFERGLNVGCICVLVLYLQTYVSEFICFCILNVFAPTFKYLLIFLSTYLNLPTFMVKCLFVFSIYDSTCLS